MSEGLLSVVPGEVAWKCDLVRLDDDRRVAERAAFDERALEVLRPNARRLYLEVLEVGAETWLIHRAGWPFDLRVADRDPTGVDAQQLRPSGAGDEVMRDLIDAFEAEAPGYSLHIHDPRTG